MYICGLLFWNVLPSAFLFQNLCIKLSVCLNFFKIFKLSIMKFLHMLNIEKQGKSSKITFKKTYISPVR